MIAKHFILDPLKYRHAGLARLRVAMLMHERTNGRFDKLYRYWANLVHPARELPAPQWLSESTINDVLKDLNKDGCRILPVRLSPEEIQEIRNFAFTTPAYADDLSQKIDIRENAIPNDKPRYMWPMQSLIGLKTVQRLMTDSSLHKIAQSYLGARGIVTSITLWLDPARDGEFSAHVYHYDNDGPRFLKFFFYISDINADTGAHKYIKGTHDHTKPPEFRLAKRYDEQTLLNYYGRENEIIFEGPAGTVLAEDTAGFHRGITPRHGYRLLMQFQYALIDIPHEEELTKRILPFTLKEMDPRLKRTLRKFYKAA